MTPADNQTWRLGNDLLDPLMDLLDTELLWRIMGWALDYYERTGKAAYLADLRREFPQWHEQLLAKAVVTAS